jgi:hypothetical protein
MQQPRVLHGRLVTIENCQHMQRVINVPNELNDSWQLGYRLCHSWQLCITDDLIVDYEISLNMCDCCIR